MSTIAWPAFILLCLTVELTPGPNMLYLAILSMQGGRRAGFSAVAGIALGLAIIGVLASLGVAELVTESPLLHAMLLLVGVLYLFWLAWRGWQETGEPGLDAVVPPRRQSAYFWRGVITNLLNPKAFLFYATVLPGFVGADAPAGLYVLLLTSISVTIATAIHLLIVILASQLRPWLSNARYRRYFRRGMALLLVGVAIWFAATNRDAIFKIVAYL